MDISALSAILSAFGLSASAGLNAYIPLLVIGLASRYTPFVRLAEPYDLLASPAVLIVLAVLLTIEVLADKVPVVDHMNDVVGLFVRPTAGALLFAASTGSVDFIQPEIALLAGILVAGAAHGAKATARPMVTASTAGIGNPIVSTAEDVAATLTSVVAVVFPLLIGAIVLTFAILVIAWRWRRSAPA